MTRLRTIEINFTPRELVAISKKEGHSLARVFEHFLPQDVGGDFQGKAIAFPATTVVYDLAGSSQSIRNNGAERFAADSQHMFKVLSDIIYHHNGIIEKFPGDGISMHFPVGNRHPFHSVMCAHTAVTEMDKHLKNTLGMESQEYRFTMAFGSDTIITKFGNDFHEELISIGDAVNTAYKLENVIKECRFNLAMDEKCKRVIYGASSFCPLERRELPSNLWRDPSIVDYWYGGIINE